MTAFFAIGRFAEAFLILPVLAAGFGRREALAAFPRGAAFLLGRLPERPAAVRDRPDPAWRVRRAGFPLALLAISSRPFEP
jgi:hypothetical protein